MIRAILFDMGGTLDGDGQHWLERFLALYRDFGVDLPREKIRGAFDEAERLSATDETIASADLRQMIALHVKWQLAHLNLADTELEQHLVSGFLDPVRKAVSANVSLLATLVERGFQLGVVSNGCGNVAKLCADFGYAPFLWLIVDSRCVGVCKPDPAIYRHAAGKLGRRPGEIIMVGDSFERDIRPAKQIGMKTAWLEGATPRDCPDPALVDIRLRKLADLPAALPSLAPDSRLKASPGLRAGILAAGHGERLRGNSPTLKPLVNVGGETLIERVLRSMAEAGASEVVIIINEYSIAIREHVAEQDWPFALRWIVETTPTSMHSFLRLVETLSSDGDSGPFLVSTVDTVAAPNAYAAFMDRARTGDAAITLALTSPSDDEKPLLVRLAAGTSRIDAFGNGEHATAGVYAVRPIILREADAAKHDGLGALRAFLGRLLERGYDLAGLPIAESIDVDRPEDIAAAEAFLARTAR